MLCGLRFCTAFVLRGEGMAAQLSARRAAKYLRGQRVHQAVFPKNYPHKDVFARYGILPPSDRALRQVKAAEIICCAMEKLGLQKSRARIALIAASPSAALESAAVALAREVRYLSLCAPGMRASPARFTGTAARAFPSARARRRVRILPSCSRAAQRTGAAPC